MEWNKRLQMIIDYVEDHLQRKEESIDIEEITRIANCSYGFFQKVFSYMNNISFSDYVRYRKLTLAGYDLKSTNLKVIDISYKYGYNSPTSFSKAFQLFHGISPTAARNPNAKLRVMGKMQVFHKTEYTWQIKQLDEFRLIGKRIKITNPSNDMQNKILEFWSDIQKNGIYSEFISMDTESNNGLFGVFKQYNAKSKILEYAIMVKSTKELPNGYHEIRIPAETWAIFDCKGAVPTAIQNGWNYLKSEWLVRYPFQHAHCPELEWYSNGNPYDENYLSQIWIPIQEKKE